MSDNYDVMAITKPIDSMTKREIKDLCFFVKNRDLFDFQELVPTYHPINKRFKNGHTFYTRAVISKRLDIMEYLEMIDCDVLQVTDSGRTLLDICRMMKHDVIMDHLAKLYIDQIKFTSESIKKNISITYSDSKRMTYLYT